MDAAVESLTVTSHLRPIRLAFLTDPNKRASLRRIIEMCTVWGARSRPSVGVLNGQVFVIGGANSSTILDTVEQYNPTTNQWTSKVSMPSARKYAAAGVANGKIYVIGGNNPANTGLAVTGEYTNEFYFVHRKD